MSLKKNNFNLGRRKKLITKDCIWLSKVSHCWKTLSPIMDQPGVFPKTGWSPISWYLSLFGNPVWADTVVNLGWGHIWLGQELIKSLVRTDISIHTEKGTVPTMPKTGQVCKQRNRKMGAIKSQKQGRQLANFAFTLFPFRTMKENISAIFKPPSSNLLQWPPKY